MPIFGDILLGVMLKYSAETKVVAEKHRQA